MAESDYDETRVIARLPYFDIEILHRRPWQGDEEQMLISVQAVPSLEAFSRLLEASSPLLFWTRMMQTVWSPGLSQILAKQAAE